jgi:hypothetical protein
MRQAGRAIPKQADPNFPSTSLTTALDWQRSSNHWPASKACAFATLLAATVDGICDAAESDANFVEASACELVQDSHVMVCGRRWHVDRLLQSLPRCALIRMEKSCASICNAFTCSASSPAAPTIAAIECTSSMFLIARNAPNARMPWPSLASCVGSWCSALLAACLSDAAPRSTADDCLRVLSLIAGALRAKLCPDFLTDPSCVELVCVCCELQHDNDQLPHICIELLDIILSFSVPCEFACSDCAVPVVGCASKCALVWQSSRPFTLSIVQPYSAMLAGFLVSHLLPLSSYADSVKAAAPHVISLNCLRCLHALLWHDDSARQTLISSMESLALALSSCFTSPHVAVRHAAAFVRSTIIIRCCTVDFTDSDGVCSPVAHRHLLHLFPDLERVKSSSRPQSSSRLRPLSASSPPVVSSADMIVFSGGGETQRKIMHLHGLSHSALAAVFQLPALVAESSGELACAILDAATVMCLSCDRCRVTLAQSSACADSSLWRVLAQVIQSSLPSVRVSGLQLASSLRHNSECLAVMSSTSSFISVLRRSIQRLSLANCSGWDVKAAACACSLLHSIVVGAPAVSSSLLYGRRFGRAVVPVESLGLHAACLQRVHREEDEASDDDELDDAGVLASHAQILNVENETSDFKAALNDEQLMSQPSASPLSPHSSRHGVSILADSTTGLSSPSQRKKMLCVGTNGLKRQRRFVAGLEQSILSDNFSCRFSAVMLAAELAAAFVTDGLPVLVASASLTFAPNMTDLSMSATSTSEPLATFPSAAR